LQGRTVPAAILATLVVAVTASCGAGAGDGNGAEFRGDFETGDTSQWDTLREAAPDRITVVTSPVRQGRYAARVEVRPGDRISTGERAELLRNPDGDEREGAAYYYGWSMLFPEGWTEPRGWGIVLQFHSGFRVPPPLALNARGDELLVQGGGGQHDDRRTYGATVLPTLQKGVWHDFVMYVRWDRDHGVIRIWHKLASQRRFRLRVTLRGVSNIQTDDGRPHRNAMRIGLYRDRGGRNTNVLFHDAMRRGTTFAEVAADLEKPVSTPASR
jgi:hypothetical protein